MGSEQQRKGELAAFLGHTCVLLDSYIFDIQSPRGVLSGCYQIILPVTVHQYHYNVTQLASYIMTMSLLLMCDRLILV